MVQSLVTAWFLSVACAAQCTDSPSCGIDDVTSLLQLKAPEHKAREPSIDGVTATGVPVTAASLSAVLPERVKHKRIQQFLKEHDEHPVKMYNWGVNWGHFYDDLMHVFPPAPTGYNLMNYGISSDSMPPCAASVPAGKPGKRLPFNDTSGANMYATLASLSPRSLAHLKVLEISSGRGGGAALLSDCFCPAEYVGLDFSPTQVKSSQSSYARQGKCPIKFVQGDAMNLPFKNESFDVVINVEASHTYPSYRKFVSEARRVLRPNGTLLTTDFRFNSDVDADQFILRDVFNAKLDSKDVTDMVIRSRAENQFIEPFLERCVEHYMEDSPKNEKWKVHADGMGLPAPQACSQFAGSLVIRPALRAHKMAYFMYAVTKL